MNIVYRNVKAMMNANDWSRTLSESIAVPEVEKSLKDYTKVVDPNRVLIGGCALSYYCRPRTTMDVDFLYLANTDIPNEIEGFKRHRPGAFEHKNTGVEVEVVTPSSINVSQELVNKVFATAITINNIQIASITGLVALKLQRLKRHDRGDICDLIATSKVELDESWPITQDQRNKFWKIVEEDELLALTDKCTR